MVSAILLSVFTALPAVAAVQINVYDASFAVPMPTRNHRGALVMENGRKVGIGKLIAGPEARHVTQTFGQILTFYKEVFGRDSYDGKGAPLNISINVNRISPDIAGIRDNAAWSDRLEGFLIGHGGFIGGGILQGLSTAIDVIGHEFTHAVIETTSKLEYKSYSGALNEHLADVFGSMVQSYYQPDSNPVLIGENAIRKPLRRKMPLVRDMLHPETGTAKSPGHMKDVPAGQDSCLPSGDNDRCGVHTLSGIPNKAAALMVTKLGSWEPLREIFYNVMTERLRSNSDFHQYRDAVVAECEHLYNDERCETVRDSFRQVGL